MTTSKDHKHPFRALVEGMTATPIEESAGSDTHEVIAHHNDGKGFQARHLKTRDYHDFKHNPKATYNGELPPIGSHISYRHYKKMVVESTQLTENHDLDWSSKNPDAGFSGTMNLDAIRSVFYVTAAKTVAQELGVPAVAAVQLLDSNWGRHFCDQVNGHLRDKSAEWFSHGDAFATAIKVVLNSGPWKRDAQRALAHMKYESDAAAHPEGHYDQNAPHYQSSGKWFPGRK